MTGGTNTDHFIYDHDDFLSGREQGHDNGNDLIFDFTRGQDRLQLSFRGFDGARGVAAFGGLDANDGGSMDRLDSFCRQGRTGRCSTSARGGRLLRVDMVRLDSMFALSKLDLA